MCEIPGEGKMGVGPHEPWLGMEGGLTISGLENLSLWMRPESDRIIGGVRRIL